MTNIWFGSGEEECEVIAKFQQKIGQNRIAIPLKLSFNNFNDYSYIFSTREKKKRIWTSTLANYNVRSVGKCWLNASVEKESIQRVYELWFTERLQDEVSSDYALCGHR